MSSLGGWVGWLRGLSSVFVCVGVVGGMLVGGGSALAADALGGVSGSFGVGGALNGNALEGEIDERTGGLALAVPVGRLPGATGDGTGLGVSYRFEPGERGGSDRFGLGAGLGWGTSFVEIDGGVRVFPASGGVYEASDAWASGLAGYVVDDARFRQETGVLEGAPRGCVEYAFSLEFPGGKEFFNADGDPVARVDAWGNTQWWEWAAEHRLVSVTDDAGNRAVVNWDEAGIDIVVPEHADGAVPVAHLLFEEHTLARVVDPSGESIDLEFDDGRLVETVSSGGARSDIAYAGEAERAYVSRVRVVDVDSGEELAVRQWEPVGEHNASGFPTYDSQAQLWASGDAEYRYKTQLSDGVSRVVNEYNARGLLVAKNVVVNDGMGDVIVQEQRFVFPHADSADPSVVPANIGKPEETHVIHRNREGGSRESVEKTTYDNRGRVVKLESPDGSVTETEYDSTVPAVSEERVPGGLSIAVGLVLSQTTTSEDGSTTRVVNIPTSDYRAVACRKSGVLHRAKSLFACLRASKPSTKRDLSSRSETYRREETPL